jgi:hypothetical protein
MEERLYPQGRKGIFIFLLTTNRQLKAQQEYEQTTKGTNSTPLTYKGAFVGVKFDGQ